MTEPAKRSRGKPRLGCLLAAFGLLAIWCLVGWALFASMMHNPFPEGSETALPAELIPSSEEE